jgi:ATP-dependent Clp protease ATP-binding subunit ClpC
MFERYTEKARRVIFFARYEASQFGSAYIETEHLLLGLLREDKALTNRFLHTHASVDSIRKQIEANTTKREKVSTSVDLPLSNESKRVLAYAAEEAERLSHTHIGTEHLFLGLLREEQCFAAKILLERRVTLSTVREAIAAVPHRPEKQMAAEALPYSEYLFDLTTAAMQEQLDPLSARELELNSTIEILCSRTRNNPVLVGEPGVGKTAIVYGLAQRIAGGGAPTPLADKRIFAVDLVSVVATAKRKGNFEGALKGVVTHLLESRNIIIFIENIQPMTSSGQACLDAATFLKLVLAQGKVQCIFEATGPGYEAVMQNLPWLGQISRVVNVQVMSQADSIGTVHAVRERYETYHGVKYSEDALSSAVHYASRYIPDRHLPGSAIELLDSAGAHVMVRSSYLPENILAIRKGIRLIIHHMEKCIANHEFERARFYSDEERKERAKLDALWKKYHLDKTGPATVNREDIEAVVSQWTGVSVASLRAGNTTRDDSQEGQK